MLLVVCAHIRTVLIPREAAALRVSSTIWAPERSPAGGTQQDMPLSAVGALESYAYTLQLLPRRHTRARCRCPQHRCPQHTPPVAHPTSCACYRTTSLCSSSCYGVLHLAGIPLLLNCCCFTAAAAPLLLLHCLLQLAHSPTVSARLDTMAASTSS